MTELFLLTLSIIKARKTKRAFIIHIHSMMTLVLFYLSQIICL